MLSIDEIKQDLKQKLHPHRYEHILSTAEMAVQLSEHLGENKDKAYLAALVHDCAKDLKPVELIQAAEHYGLSIDEIERYSPHLLHGPVGACVAEERYGITDKEILSAVKYHTMGKVNMTMLEKIVFLADIIEITRTYEHISEIRDLAFIDFDLALLKAYDGIIHFVLKKQQLLHPCSAEARNHILMHLNGKNNERK